MVHIKTEKEIAVMRQGGNILARVLRDTALAVRSGMKTKELDAIAEQLTLQAGAQVAFRGYQGFPGVLCVAVNDEGVHTAPSGRALEKGDILTLDMGLIWQGWYLDMARTIPVGEIDEEKKKLLRVTKECHELALKETRVGKRLGDIGFAIQDHAEKNGYNAVRELCGHGIGRELHEDPKVLCYGTPGTGPELKEGMVICIEPMITQGDWKLKLGKDGFSFNTKDGSLFCHIEDTIAITKKGPVVLTQG
ncbi:MAG: type I methionyl aminopeptidase [Candidatus Wildermuthbacteria bacterium]|nr:type I methionyl aminopeptidase [Candidatus Wildermuthbacteria bacterium]